MRYGNEYIPGAAKKDSQEIFSAKDRFVTKEDGRNFLTLTVDLGLGGMKIKTHSSFMTEKSQPFNLVLGTETIQVMGRIVYNGTLRGKQKVAGIQFLELSHHGRKLLRHYLGTLEDLQ